MVPGFGGIYLDADVIVLKSFDPLRRYRTVMGRQSSNGICNGILISEKRAPFLRMLLEQYESYTGANEMWAVGSVEVPHTLARVFPSFIYVEEASLNRPSWDEVDKIYERAYNWTGNYAIHLWLRVQKMKNVTLVPQSAADIDCNNATIGQVARHVYYESQSMEPSKCNELDKKTFLSR